MPATLHWRTLGLVLALITLTVAVARADEAPVPMAEETFHHLLFENRYAAVYDVVLPPGAVMRFHRHPTNHLAVVVAGGTLRNEVVGAPVTERSTGAGGTVVYLPAGPPHRQSNIGATPVHFVAAEVLAPAPAGKVVDATVKRAGCSVVQDNAVITAWLCRLAPGARLVALPVGVPALRVALGVGQVGLVDPHGAEVTATLAPGAVTWLDGDVRADVVNRGDVAVELVEVAWRPEAKPIPRTVDIPRNPGATE